MMGKITAATWQELRATLVAEYLAAAGPQDPFVTVMVCDPASPEERAPALAWWPTADLSDRHRTLQEHFDRFPGTHGPVDQESLPSKGLWLTLEALARHRSDLETCIAILAAGAARGISVNLLQSARNQGWRGLDFVVRIGKAAAVFLHADGLLPSWHHTSADVMPEPITEFGEEIPDTLHGALRFLAQALARMVRVNRPVMVVFTADGDTEIRAAIQEGKAAAARIREQSAAQWEVTRPAREVETARQADLCRWQSLSAAELTRMVWSRPTTAIAKEFGVSDVAIAKRCRRDDIPKPPAGFWARVASGKIAHPQGMPQAGSKKKPRRRARPQC